MDTWKPFDGFSGTNPAWDKAENDISPPLRVKKHFDTFRENLRIFTEEEKDCGLLKISQFSGRNPDQTNCFSAACALEKPDAAYTPPRLIHLDFLRNLF